MIQIPISRDYWITATALAKLRVSVGDSRRAKHQDRGHMGNILADMQGCMGELVGLKYVNHFGIDCDHEILATVPMQSYDVSYLKNGKPFNVDVKCVFITDPVKEQGKRFFLIDQAAHAKREKKNVHAYLPVLTDLGSGLAIVGNVIEADRVDQWPLKEFGYGSSAHCVNLTDLSERYFGASYFLVKDAIQRAGNRITIDEAMRVPRISSIPPIGRPESADDIAKTIAKTIDMYMGLDVS